MEHNETKDISDPALEQIPQAVIDGQTLAVDSISGATRTSEGIINGINEAL